MFYLSSYHLKLFVIFTYYKLLYSLIFLEDILRYQDGGKDVYLKMYEEDLLLINNQTGGSNSKNYYLWEVNQSLYSRTFSDQISDRKWT